MHRSRTRHERMGRGPASYSSDRASSARSNKHTPMSPLSAFQPHNDPDPCTMGSFELWSSMACRVPEIHVKEKSSEGKLRLQKGLKASGTRRERWTSG